MAKKKGLSRGLEHLFEQNMSLDEEYEINMIDIEDIIPNPYQPRKVFDKEALEELAESIKNHGLFQPILLRRAVIGYEIISGERRFRASKLAHLTEIPAIIYDYSDEQMMEVALVENIQREDLNVIEEAQSYQMLSEKLSLTQNEIASKVGKSRSYVANIMRILKLDKDVIEKIEENKLTMGHVKTLITIEDKKRQKEIIQKILNENLNVRQAEELIKEKKKANSNQKKQVVEVKNKSTEYKRLEAILRDKLDSKVVIKGKDKGSIVIDFNSREELERILENMKII